MPSEYLNPESLILKHGDKLPHWQQNEAMQFVTFRLGDALPLKKVRIWKEQRRDWLHVHPKPWTAEQLREYEKRFTWRIEKWLDEGSGSCVLKDPAARDALMESLMRFQGERVRHEAWVIMPNHVHLLFVPLIPLPDLIEAWKSVSARFIRQGPIWQRNYRDTMIRDTDHYINVVRYIRNNPKKAKLSEGEFTLWEGERAAKVSSGG